MDIRYTLQHFQAAWVSNSHARTVTIPAGLTNSVMLIIKDCSNDLPWTTFTGITVNGSSAGIVDVVNSGSGLASQSIRAWRLNSPPAGTYDVSVDFNTMSANGGTLTIIVLDDVNQTTPIADTEWGSSGSVSSPIGHAALTTPSGGYAIFSAAVVGGTSLVPSVGTNVGSAGNASVSYLLNGTSTTFSWTGGSPAPASIIAFSLTPAGGGDITPPTLTSPTGTSTGSTTASGTVTTDEANGTLYRLASTNATESVTTVKTAALTQAVTATGSQAVTFTGLSPSTTYYAHYVHTDAANNDSARVSSSSFTTGAGGDTTPPTLSSPTGTATGATTATGTVSTNEANGTLYYVTTVNATETGTTVKAGSSQAVTATGVQNVSRTGLTASTTYRHHYLHRDAAGNDSTVSSSATFTTSAAPSGGTLTLTTPLCNNTGLISGRWISATGVRLSIVNESTGNTVLVVTGRATDASGVLTAAITDAAIVTGQTYRILPSWSGNAGLSQVLTAT